MAVSWGLRQTRYTTLGIAAVLSLVGPVVQVHAQPTSLNWGQIGTAAAPQGREFAASDYDSVRGRTVIFGGDAITPGSATFVPPLGDTWEWDGTNWVQRTPAASPPAMTSAAMAFDSSRGVSVLFGGTNFSSLFGQTWEWDGNNWTQRFPATSPSPRVWSAMAYDSARGRIVLFGGSGGQADTWEYDGNNWIQRFPTTSPSIRYGHAMAYDSVRHVTVLFGGHDPSSGSRLNDTWEWDGTNWTQRFSASVPYPRQFTSMEFDTALGKTILFGGDHLRPLALGPINDTWQWDGNQWVQDWTDAAPTPRLGESMVYDSARDRSVMFGGTEGGSPLFVFPNDTWELGDGIVTPPGTPDAAFANTSAFNAQPYGTTSQPAYALLSSTGTGPLHITSMSVTGDFAVAGTDCPLAPDPLAAGMRCLIAITFTPTATGTRTGTLTVSDDGSGGGQQMALQATAVPIATSLSVMRAAAIFGGTAALSATLTAGGKPVVGADITFTLPNSAAVTVPTDANGVAQAPTSVAGVHAGYYFQGIQASYAGDSDHVSSTAYAPLAVSQLGSLTYGGAFFVSDTTAPTITATVNQNMPGSDPQFLDFSQLPVSVQFDVSGPGGTFETSALVSNAASWASTGQGIASASLGTLSDGAYTVTATFAATFYPYPGNQFVVGDDGRASLASSPSQRGFTSGGGAIAADPSGNTNDTHGYFGFEFTPGRVPQGNLVYTYRTHMDVGGGTFRDVDVVVTSSDVTALSGNQQTSSASGHFGVAFIDSLTGVHYPAFEFSGGTYTLNVSGDSTKSAAGFALMLTKPDGSLFHATAPLNSRGQVPLVSVVLGDIVCSL